MTKIIFVCTGNTCRSPMAEYILKNITDKSQFQVSSAGIYANEGGGAHKLTAQVLADNGIDISGFKSRRLTDKMLSENDLIIFMTKAQAEMFKRYPNTFSAFDYTGYDINDPYGGSIESYKEVYNQLVEVCDKIINKHK